MISAAMTQDETFDTLPGPSDIRECEGCGSVYAVIDAAYPDCPRCATEQELRVYAAMWRDYIALRRDDPPTWDARLAVLLGGYYDESANLVRA